MIIVISGPSGAGKTTITKTMREWDGIYYSVSVTTRKKRGGEIDGYDYRFVDDETFKKWINEDRFLEYALVYGNYYGTLKEPVEKAIKEGKIVLMDLDTKGSLRIKEIYSEEAVLVFLITDSPTTLKERLIERGTESPEVREKRIRALKNELMDGKNFDYVIKNTSSIEETIEKIKIIINAEKLKTHRNFHIFDDFLGELY